MGIAAQARKIGGSHLDPTLPSGSRACQGPITSIRQEIPTSHCRSLRYDTHPHQTPPVRIAFKEWAVIVEALGRGDQSLILRKGGIAEGRPGFRIEHPQFLLFPTQFHQHRDQVTAGGQALFDALPEPAGTPDTVGVAYFAKVCGWRKLDSLEQTLRLEDLHVWRPEVITERFAWGREASIHAIALRVYRLVEPRSLPVRPEYSGCRSWIELEIDVDLTGANPVLDEPVHQQRMHQMQAALGGPLTSFS